MRENEIEQYLVKKVKSTGGRAYKWVSPGNDGVPDRIVIWPDGRIVFVELKAPEKQPTPLQSAKHSELRRLKQAVNIIDSKEKVDCFIRGMVKGDVE
ncbi:MAG: VRR-NUC domain-containing protein [Candidatus Metalachnospira sp.]|nr:VRR-NUC domain-containing protein [Candidatus Metalachnospira sp.]